MTKSYDISVILPTHNRAHLLNRAINSVLDQLETRDELIVIDDGSTDDTKSVVTAYGKQINYIRTPGLGAGAARNIGVKNAKNDLICFIDSDDEWLPGKVEIQRAFMEARKDILFCFSNFAVNEERVGGEIKHFNVRGWSKDYREWDDILGQGHPITSLISLPKGIPDFKYYVGDMYYNEMRANYISVITLMMRRDGAEKNLYFAEDTSTYEDWEFFGRLTQAGLCAYLDIELACAHAHGAPRLTDAHITECAQARIAILERIWGSDQEFQQKHGEDYRCVLDEQRLILADGLLVRGETARARVLLSQRADRTSVARNLLAVLPGSLAKKLLALRRLLKS